MMIILLLRNGAQNCVQHPETDRSLGTVLVVELYVPVTVHREQSVKKEYQQDATI